MRAWDIFISHAGEDKCEVAIPLSEALERAGLRVWLDRQEIRMGDSLREKIDEGLANSRFGVVILSPSFLAKKWTRNELDGLFAIEDAIGSNNIILPVWHRVDKATLARYSPILADRVAANVSEGIPAVANSIIQVVTTAGRGAPVEVAHTPARLLIELLERAPDHADVEVFLASYPKILRDALGFSGRTELWSMKLGSLMVDYCTANVQHTTEEVTWYLVQFQPAAALLFVDSALSPERIAHVNELRSIRRWIGSNLAEARKILPKVKTEFKGIIVAGRRQLLSELDREYLRCYNEELSGIKVRTYDWLIDAATKKE
jgi:hypothetical protein